MKIIRFIRVLVFCVSFQICVGSVHAQEVQIVSKEGTRYATSSGSAEVQAAPDKVVVALAVRNWDKDLRTAYAENSNRTKSVLDLRTKYHIDKQQIQSSGFNVTPTYPPSSSSSSYDPERASRPTGYEVSQQITLVLTEVGSLPSLLADAFDAGANIVSSIKFDTSNMRKLKDEARALALEAAKEKAEEMAVKLNAKIGKAVIVKEAGSEAYGIRAFPNSNYYVPNNRLVQTDSGTADTVSSVAPGSIMVSSAVSVTFEMTE